MIKRILIKLINYFCQVKYEIGFIAASDIPQETNSILKGIEWLNYGDYKEGWFADPFLLSVTDSFVQVLAEEFSYKTKKGSISLLNIKRDTGGYTLEGVKKILELDNHLSFPLILEEQGSVYVCPENYQSGGVYIYEYNKNNEKLENPIIIISDPLVDVQIVKHEDAYYAFGVVCKTGRMEETRSINIYKSNNLLGKYALSQTILNDNCEERGAGQIFRRNCKIIRPAQCCEGGYGKMLIFYNLEFINGEICETELCRLKPQRLKKNGLSLHTFNVKNGLCVVDGHDYKNLRNLSRWIAPFLNYCLTIYYSLIERK